MLDIATVAFGVVMAFWLLEIVSRMSVETWVERLVATIVLFICVFPVAWALKIVIGWIAGR